MRNLAAVLAATAVAAAVTAAISLPAGADQGPPPDQLVACLRAHGVDIPADARDFAIKAWIADHESGPAVDRAMSACQPGGSPGETSPEKLAGCLRDHGLDAPAAIADLKPWIVHQLDTEAGKAALAACGVDTAPDEKREGDAKPGGCSPADPAETPKSTSAATLKQ